MSFGKEYIRKELKKLDDVLDEQLKLYLIGGGNMSLLNLKDATKDIDVILDKEKDLPVLKNALLNCGYEEKNLPTYQKMGTRLLMENEDGFRWDVFIKVVCNGLMLSPYMKERIGEIQSGFKNMRLFLLSKEDVFLFKGITERERDLEDMHILYLHGLDFEIIKEEIKWQSENSGIAWIAYFFQRLMRLQEEYGIIVPNIKEIEKMAEEDAAISLILEKIHRRKYTMEELVEELKEDENWIRELIQKLEKQGKIKAEGNTIMKKE